MERDWAMILETLVLMNDRTKAAPLALKISESLTREYWMITQTTAYCLLSMAKFAGTSGTSKKLQFTYRINDGKTITANTEKPFSKVTLNFARSATDGKIQIENKGQGMLYARVVLSGIPQTGGERTMANNLSMKLEFKDINGSTVDVSRLTQGSDFMVVVTVTNPSLLRYKDMALTQIFPSGWEIRNNRLFDFKSSQEVSVPNYQDFRDDRVLTYFDLARGQSKAFIIPLNASYVGRFYLPGIYCEAMYDNTVNAILEGQWIEVVNP